MNNFIIKKINPKTIYVGDNFNFGSNKSGDVELLERMGRRLGFRAVKIRHLKISGRIISSTLIRSLIRGGNLARASLFLGRPVSVFGEVIKGKGVGRILGFPTANVFCPQEAMPSPGVYAIKSIINGRKLLGMAFHIGAFAYSKKNKIKANLEAHLFNFNNNLYGEEIEIEFYKRIRPIKRFKNQDYLKKQIENDAREVRKFFRSF